MLVFGKYTSITAANQGRYQCNSYSGAMYSATSDDRSWWWDRAFTFIENPQESDSIPRNHLQGTQMLVAIS